MEVSEASSNYHGESGPLREAFGAPRFFTRTQKTTLKSIAEDNVQIDTSKDTADEQEKKILMEQVRLLHQENETMERVSKAQEGG